jgi:hypothetical protein
MAPVPRLMTFAVVVALLTGCAGRISPRTVRDEVVRQTGSPPARERELSMGRLTTALVRRALGPDARGSLPLAGLTAIELAVYDLPADRPGGAQPLDFSDMTPWGWDNVVRWRDGGRSALVMVRSCGDAIRDLALVAAGDHEVLYARLRGELPATLPEAMRVAVARDGPASIERELLEALDLQDTSRPRR